MASTAVGGGIVVDTTEVTIPITAGIPVIINPLLVAPQAATAGWGVDANNLLYPNYAAIPDTTIPPGYSKFAYLAATITIENGTQGDESYDVQFVESGTPIGLPYTVVVPSNDAETLTVISARVVDISATETYGLQITGIGTGADLTLYSFEMQADDKLLWQAP